MKKSILLFLILLPISIFCQKTPVNVTVTVGAEREIIPEIGDTIPEYFNQSHILKKIKFRDKEKFSIIEYKENGKIYTSTDFPLENLKYKTLTKFNDAGNIILIANYDHGIVTGYFQKFHENGKPMEIGNYDRMRKIGIWKYYDEDGILIKEEIYENGKLLTEN
jgi:antitoxin component YwqK of YwqJK toxin-antitoxin module